VGAAGEPGAGVAMEAEVKKAGGGGEVSEIYSGRFAGSCIYTLLPLYILPKRSAVSHICL